MSVNDNQVHVLRGFVSIFKSWLKYWWTEFGDQIEG
jgi:hypothetical protein